VAQLWIVRRHSINYFMSFKCPNCETVIYSRAHKVCHTCGIALPQEFLLPESQIRHVEQSAERERKADRESDLNLKMPDNPYLPPSF